MKNTKSILLILCCLFLLSLSLRLFRLGTAPESTTWDETALGYNTYSLSLTGADEYGVSFPLLLKSFNDYKPALYPYLSIPFIRLFGLSITSTRLLSAFSGASLVFSLYLFTKNLTNNTRTALVASLLSVASPLLLLYSRMALEANLSLALFIAGTALVFTPIPKSFRYPLGLIFLALSAYAYHSARYIVPFAVLASLLLPTPIKERSFKLKSLLLLFLLYLPLFYFILNPAFNTRFSQTSLFTNRQIIFGSFASLGTTSQLLTFLSRSYFYLLDFSGRYLGYFNPFELFIKASGHPSYRVEQLGIYNLVEIIPWFVGVIILLKKWRHFLPFLLIILITPVPASLTVDWFIALRASLLWPLFVVVSAIGVEYLINLKLNSKTIILRIVIMLMWLFYAGKALETVIIYHPYVNAGAYQYGFAQAIPFVKSIQNKYDKVIIDSPHAQPYIFLLFYSAFPPSEYQKINQIRQIDFVKHTNYDFGPYTFSKIYFPTDRHQKNTLFLGSIFSLPQDQLNNAADIAFVKDFYYPDGSISFRVVATKP